MEVVTIVPPDPESLVLPPRMVAAGGSAWLPKDGVYSVLPHFGLKRDETGCWVIVGHAGSEDRGPLPIPTDTAHPTQRLLGNPVFLNGERIYGAHLLADGDHLVHEHTPGIREHMIFQQNPVLTTKTRQPIEIQLSYRMKKAVQITSESIRFHPNTRALPWYTIRTIRIRSANPNAFSVSLFSTEGFKLRKFSEQKIPFVLSADEFQALGLWLYNVAPCLPSVMNNLFPIPDAYISVAREKVIAPLKNGTRQLPYSEEEILAVSPTPPLSGRIRALFSRTFLLILAIELAVLVISLINLAAQNNDVLTHVFWLVIAALALCIFARQLFHAGRYVLQR